VWGGELRKPRGDIRYSFRYNGGAAARADRGAGGGSDGSGAVRAGSKGLSELICVPEGKSGLGKNECAVCFAGLLEEFAGSCFLDFASSLTSRDKAR